MARDSVSELIIFIKKEIESLEEQNENLFKAKALLEVSLEDSFLDKSKPIRHAYLSCIDDMP